jgi:uncharacterized protein YjbI with pentapeptide repeats
MRDAERSVGKKKLVRKAEPPSKRRIGWPRWTGFGNKTIWDWLQLLIVPLMLAALGFWFTAQQDQRQQRTEIQRADAERKLAEQRAQDEALQAYLDQMSQLMLERNLLEAKDDTVPPPDPALVLARARTSTIILRLDDEHNESVTRFLGDSELTTGVESQGLLSEMELSHAALSNAQLPGADLHYSSLNDADLSGANLAQANLSQVGLRDADLSGAELFEAELQLARLEEANLKDADLAYASLSGAYLMEANLSGAYLKKVNLRDAHLKGADLSGAFLKETNLTDAHVSERQLLTAKSLEGATMPDGQTLRGDKTPNGPTFEDWLKSKGRVGDG